LTGSGFSVPVATVNQVQNNTALGRRAGRFNYTGSNNTFIGHEAGYNSNAASGSVMIGYQAGLNETNSNRLYISNSSTATPLIFGNFATPTVRINGKFEIPSQTPSSASDTGTAGQIAWDSDYIYVCVATNTWKRVGISTW